MLSTGIQHPFQYEYYTFALYSTIHRHPMRHPKLSVPTPYTHLMTPILSPVVYSPCSHIYLVLAHAY